MDYMDDVSRSDSSCQPCDAQTSRHGLAGGGRLEDQRAARHETIDALQSLS